MLGSLSHNFRTDTFVINCKKCGSMVTHGSSTTWSATEDEQEKTVEVTAAAAAVAVATVVAAAVVAATEFLPHPPPTAT